MASVSMSSARAGAWRASPPPRAWVAVQAVVRRPETCVACGVCGSVRGMPGERDAPRAAGAHHAASLNALLEGRKQQRGVVGPTAARAAVAQAESIHHVTCSAC